MSNTWITPWGTRTGAYTKRPYDPRFPWESSSDSSSSVDQLTTATGALTQALAQENYGGADGLTDPADTNDIGPASSTVGGILGTVAGIATGLATGNPGYAGAAKGVTSGLAQGKTGWDLTTDIAKGYLFGLHPELGLAYSAYKGLNTLSDYLGWSGPSTGTIGTTESVESVGSRGYQSGIPGIFGIGDISFAPATNIAAREAMDMQARENDLNFASPTSVGYGPFGPGYDGLPSETSYGDLGGQGPSSGPGPSGDTNADGNSTGGGPSGGGTGPGANGGEDGGASDGANYVRGGLVQYRRSLRC